MAPFSAMMHLPVAARSRHKKIAAFKISLLLGVASVHFLCLLVTIRKEWLSRNLDSLGSTQIMIFIFPMKAD